MIRVRQGDALAQRELYNIMVLSMFNTVLRILKNKEDAQDCVQVSFSLLFRKIDQFDLSKGAFSTWSTRIFINESLRILRQKKIHFEILNDNIYLEANSTSPIENLHAEDILNLINSLPDQMRIIFSLYEIEGYSHKEIAKIIEIAESSSRTYLMRAKMKLRLLLKSNTEETIYSAEQVIMQKK